MEDQPNHSIPRPFSRISEPGSAPGTVIAVPDNPKPVIHIMAYSNGQLVDENVESLGNVRELVEQHRVTWINIDGLGDAEVIRYLGEVFELHSLALEDVVNLHQIPKIEQYGDKLFIVARMIDEKLGPQTEQISFFLGENFLLTFQEGIPGDCLEPVRNRIRRSSGRIRHRGADYLAYALLDCIIDHYFPLVESFGERLDSIDDQLIEQSDEDSIAAVHKLRRELLALRRTLRPHREMINQMARESDELISEETRLYLRDCYDHVIQLSEAIDSYRETCSDLRDYHLSAISTRTNDVMKTLTIIATIFIPLSFIAGLYGMNFENMPETHWTYGYPFALFLMASVAGSLVYWFRSKGWFPN